MADHSLHDIYSRVLPSYKKVFVVPLIRFSYPTSDYLYLLYKPFFEKDKGIEIESISALRHWKFVWQQISGRDSILHYHWLEFQDLKSMLGMVYKIACIALLKLFGGKLIWTVHNLKPHNKKWLGMHQKMHSWMAQKSDLILVHSKHVIEDVIRYYSVSANKIVVHAHPRFPANIIPKEKAISKLNSKYNYSLTKDDLVLGFFGAISSYKKIPETIKLLNGEKFNGKFLVFGYIKKGEQKLDQQLREMANTYEWFNYSPGFLEEESIPVVLSAFDWFLINYEEFTTSGSFELAHSYKRKIIAPKKSSILDYEGQENVFLFSDEEELKESIRRMA